MFFNFFIHLPRALTFFPHFLPLLSSLPPPSRPPFSIQQKIHLFSLPLIYTLSLIFSLLAYCLCAAAAASFAYFLHFKLCTMKTHVDLKSFFYCFIFEWKRERERERNRRWSGGAYGGWWRGREKNKQKHAEMFTFPRTRVVSKPREKKIAKVTVTWTTCYESLLLPDKYPVTAITGLKMYKRKPPPRERKKVHEENPIWKKGKEGEEERERGEKRALKRLNCHPWLFTHVLLLLLALLNFLQDKGAVTREQERITEGLFKQMWSLNYRRQHQKTTRPFPSLSHVIFGVLWKWFNYHQLNGNRRHCRAHTHTRDEDEIWGEKSEQQ